MNVEFKLEVKVFNTLSGKVDTTVVFCDNSEQLKHQMDYYVYGEYALIKATITIETPRKL